MTAKPRGPIAEETARLERNSTAVGSIPLTMVYCVVCIANGTEVTHIFSTDEGRKQWAAADDRPHVFYDYAIDCPERFEGPMQ